jgi:hypothetical protein
VLDPSGFVVENNDGTEPARTAPAGRVEINGYLTLKALDQLPADAPVGALVLPGERCISALLAVGPRCRRVSLRGV